MDQNLIPTTIEASNERSREAWEKNAAFWDERMGEGNDFQRLLLAPALESLLSVQPGQRILEAACGNGQFARRLVDLGANVVAFDFAAQMIEHARARSTSYTERLTFHVTDATDRAQLRTLAGEPFDALVCNMAFMDMAAIEPLIDAGKMLLKPGRPFVFSVQHPCFNSVFASLVAESHDFPNGRWGTEYHLKLSNYKEQKTSYGEAIAGQPTVQLYFHRPLEELLGAFFRDGYVLDGLLEPTFPTRSEANRGPSWSNLLGIPPVLVARMRVLTKPSLDGTQRPRYNEDR